MAGSPRDSGRVLGECRALVRAAVRLRAAPDPEAAQGPSGWAHAIALCGDYGAAPPPPPTTFSCVSAEQDCLSWVHRQMKSCELWAETTSMSTV